MRKTFIYILVLSLLLSLPVKALAIDWQEMKTINKAYFFIRYDADSILDCGDCFTVWCIYGLSQEEMKKYSTAGKQAIAFQSKLILKKTACVCQSLIDDIVYSDLSMMRINEHKKPMESKWIEFGPGSAFYELWETTKQKIVPKN